MPIASPPVAAESANVPAWNAALRARRAFPLALAASILVHLAFMPWPIEVATAPESTPLMATITELPPPPKPVPPAAPAKPKAQRAARPVPARSPVATPEPDPLASPADEAPALIEPTAEAIAAGPELATEPVEVSAPLPPAEHSEKTLPPRVDLVYKGFLGRQFLLLGDATYRFEHSGNQYRISSVGELRGLAALLYPGQGRVESRGSITSAGLRPYEFVFERSIPERREVAQFDWETGIVTLNELKTAALDVPTFDWLAIMWQYYFSPPVEPEVAFSVATTRRVGRYTITREDDERIEWGQGEIDTVRWHRKSEDGRSDGYVWLAPSLQFIPVKMRYVGPQATFEAVLDSIRVDEKLARQ
jgi:hypothetical protein